MGSVVGWIEVSLDSVSKNWRREKKSSETPVREENQNTVPVMYWLHKTNFLLWTALACIRTRDNLLSEISGFNEKL